MSEPKPLASLSSSLLARKGQAAPAMRRQSMMLSSIDGGAQTPGQNALEDLGWNDMGESPEPSRATTGLSPMGPSAAPAQPMPAPVPLAQPQPITPHVQVQAAETPAVVRQQEELAREIEQPAFVPEAKEQVFEAAASEEPVAEVQIVQPAPVVQKVEPVAIAPVLVSKAPARSITPRAAAGSRGKAAFTLRLDSDRHLKLRLVCAVNHRSAQQIVTQALDEFLARQPSVSELVNGHGH